MIFRQTKLAGAYLIEPEPIHDERGQFARVWCEREFGSKGLSTKLAQMSVSFSSRCGTLRGLHYQVAPHAEVKLVRCTRGSIYDVIVDLRPNSSSYLQWFGVELSWDRRNMVYAPEGFAHGFQTLEDDTEVSYQISQPYAPASARGLRFSDPILGITWPLIVSAISERDANWADFEKERRM
jgi:dTDP-4-dehydrorhamnose 3,5-epimerase